jgi:hypothetical protein
MDERSSLSRSTCCTCFRRLTKWLLNISDASDDNRGAHFLRKHNINDDDLAGIAENAYALQ